MRRRDEEKRQLALVRLGIHVQRDARDRVAVDVEHVIIAELFLDRRACALHQLVAQHRVFRQPQQRADVLFLRGPDLLEFIRVDQRAHALVGKHLGQERLVRAAVDQMHARNALQTRARRRARYALASDL